MDIPIAAIIPVFQMPDGSKVGIPIYGYSMPFDQDYDYDQELRDREADEYWEEENWFGDEE